MSKLLVNYLSKRKESIMKAIMYYCPVCANILTDSSEAEKIQIAEMKCIYCESELVNTEKKMREFVLYGNEHDLSADDAIRELYVYSNPLFDKEKCDKRVAIETAYREEMDQLHRKVDAMRRSGSNVPKCPKCGSTAITAGQRGFNILTGFIGSGATMNRCAQCGHKWKP